MIAYRMLRSQESPEFQDISRPVAGSGQLLINVAGCGLCHTDLGTVRRRTMAEWADTPPPFTMGHEVAGWIEEIGEGVIGFKTGEPVAVVPLWCSCGRCPPCRRGEENFCFYVPRMIGAGVGFNGGLAEYMVTDWRYAGPLGDLDPIVAAPLTDAGLTTYTAIKSALLSLCPGTTAAVIGVGGLGLLAVQMLRTLSGARVVALDRDEKHLSLAKTHGADVAIASDASAVEPILEP